MLYSQIHSDYHALIVHALSCHPETQERWGKAYWVNWPVAHVLRNRGKKFELLLHTLVCSAPNRFFQFNLGTLCTCVGLMKKKECREYGLIEGVKTRVFPILDTWTNFKMSKKFHQRLSAVPELTLDAQRGLQWLKHLVLTPKLWSLSDNLWHPDFSKTGCALAFNDRTLEDFDSNTLQMYRQYICLIKRWS